MNWKNLPPKYLVFDTMEDFGEWLKDHSQDVPLRGEVWFFKSKAEELFWLKAGNGKDKICDLEYLLI